MSGETDEGSSTSATKPHRRRPRYSGKHPRRFEDKYKEHNPARYAETVSKVIASGKTPAGTHRPIMVAEILEVLNPTPGDTAIDCTLGYGGHTQEILRRIQPNGKLLGLDADPIEFPKTVARIRSLGFGADVFDARRTNFAALSKAVAEIGMNGADIILADLGVSSMQLDDPTRGFSTKVSGPLDLRMNPERGKPAARFLQQLDASTLHEMLIENSDEPHAQVLARMLAGKMLENTLDLANTVRNALRHVNAEESDLSIRRVFQTLRIAVNDEFGALESLLRQLPSCLKPGGRVAILTFHSGEDRRVKKAFEGGFRDGSYAEVSEDVIRAGVEERRSNSRSTSAKLRWARRNGKLRQ